MVVEILTPLGISTASHMIGKLLDKKLSDRERKKIACEIIADTLNRFVEDKNAHTKFATTETSTQEIRLCQILYRLKEDLITIIVKTDRLVDEEITNKLRELAKVIGDMFNKLPLYVDTEDKISVHAAIIKHYGGIRESVHFPSLIEDLIETRINTILKEIEKLDD